MQFKTAVTADKRLYGAVISPTLAMAVPIFPTPWTYRLAVSKYRRCSSSDPDFNRLSALLSEPDGVNGSSPVRPICKPSLPRTKRKSQTTGPVNWAQIDAGRIDTRCRCRTDSQKGGLTRRAFGLKGKGFSAYFDYRRRQLTDLLLCSR